MHRGVTIHQTASVSPDAVIAEGTIIWHHSQVREGAEIGANCIVGKNVYIDSGVHLGDNVKVQNNSSLYHPLTIEDGVFIGPHVIFANDMLPRAINPDGSRKSASDWQRKQSFVRYGASVGAGAIVLPGLTVGTWAMVGAGAVVTHDVPERAIVVGNPARVVGRACVCGARMNEVEGVYHCPVCGRNGSLSSEC